MRATEEAHRSLRAHNNRQLNLAAAGVTLDARGNIKVDEFLRTSAPHIFAAGDVTGRLMLVPGAIEDGFLAATNAVQGPTLPLRHRSRATRTCCRLR